MKQIKTEADYEAALAKIDVLMDAPDDVRDNVLYERLTEMVMAYEEEHYPMPPPPVSAALQFRMEQEGLSQATVSRITGIPKPRISEILSGEREPSKEHIKALHQRLGIPLYHLLADGNDESEIDMDYVATTSYPDTCSNGGTDFDLQYNWNYENECESDGQTAEEVSALAA